MQAEVSVCHCKVSTEFIAGGVPGDTVCKLYGKMSTSANAAVMTDLRVELIQQLRNIVRQAQCPNTTCNKQTDNSDPRHVYCIGIWYTSY